MKTQDFGWSHILTLGVGTAPDAPPGGPVYWAKKNYQENRSNGRDEDSPAKDIPLDGECFGWIKCPDQDTLPRPQADGSFKEGWEDGDYDGWYRIRYQEGPGDKAWMEERDGNYLARLEREGQVAKAAELRASLPPTHPHYRPRTPAVPAPSAPPVPTAGSGGASGCAAASPSP